MTITITPEYVMNLGKEVSRIAVKISTPAERIADLTPEELTARLTLEQRLAGLATNDVLPLFSFEDIEAYLERHRPKPKADGGKTD